MCRRGTVSRVRIPHCPPSTPHTGLPLFLGLLTGRNNALEGWAESLADEVAPFGITTTIVEPGAFRTKPPKDRARSVFPENVIDDYAEATREKAAAVKGFNGHEPGHRDKLASSSPPTSASPNGPQSSVMRK